MIWSWGKLTVAERVWGHDCLLAPSLSAMCIMYEKCVGRLEHNRQLLLPVIH